MSRHERQDFLGQNSEAILANTTIGIVGLGGGGSQIVQQLAHIGIGGYVNSDPQVIEESNITRLIGAIVSDIINRTLKVSIAERMIRGLLPNARIISVAGPWQDAVEHLKLCDIIIGAVDSFSQREQLERFSRRYLIPYVDIGMDIIKRPNEIGYLISGQVILSLPGQPCLRCCNFITDQRLEAEAGQYGDAGGRPQVVWSNGTLASTAIGIVMQILTPWFEDVAKFNYLEYDGNRLTVKPSFWVKSLETRVCEHHPADETGDPFFDIRDLTKTQEQNLSKKQSKSDSRYRCWWKKLLKWLKLSF